MSLPGRPRAQPAFGRIGGLSAAALGPAPDQAGHPPPKTTTNDTTNKNDHDNATTNMFNSNRSNSNSNMTRPVTLRLCSNAQHKCKVQYTVHQYNAHRVLASLG